MICTFVVMTIKENKFIKRKFNLNIEDGNTKGVVTITRIKVTEYKTYDNRLYTTCDVDIKYKGTINRWGTKMGPFRGEKEGSTYKPTWGSKIFRNKSVRSEVSYKMVNLLKYFGIDVIYKHNLKIKKIVWDE